MKNNLAKPLRTACLAAGALLLPAAAAQCAHKGPVAAVVYVSGDVRLMRAGAREAKQARVSDELFLGDALETGTDGLASVALVYGAELRVNSASVLEFSPGRKDGFVKLSSGQVWTRLLRKNAGLQIRTPSAICAIRGTEADVEQHEVLTVKVYEGHVDVVSPNGRVSLRAGELSKVAWPVGTPLQPVRLKPSQAGTWQARVTSPGLMSALEKLEAYAGAEKELDLELGLKAGGVKNLKIKLKKKAGATGN